ncbi:50S ribosomal protein L9 [uncultured Gammaproteobacteria bacterium]
MEVILLERVEKLGQMGQVVKVRAGYARNFLLPLKKAMRATKDNLTSFENQKAVLQANNLEQRKDAELVAAKFQGLAVVITRQAGDTGILYGSVAGRDIAEAAGTAGYTIDRRQVAIDKPIKTLGLFDVRVILHPEVSIQIKVNVARTLEEAELQAKRGGMVTASELREAERLAEEAADKAERAEQDDED